MHCRLISDYSGAHAAIPTVQGVGSDDCWFLNIFCNGSPLRKKVAFIAKFIIAPALLLVVLVAVRIYTYGNNAVDVHCDAAIVLGAAVWGNDVSPVFRERINHAIDLYRRGKVRKIIFTGGQGNRNELTEAAEARQYGNEIF